MTAGPTLATLAADLESGRATARGLVEACLERSADPAGEGARTWISLDEAGGRAAADVADAQRAAGIAPSRWAGIPLAIKDLFGIRGQVTGAGATVLSDRAPAEADAPAIARLRREGFVLLGRTNMTEFAYSGLGLNPHHGTPLSVWRREVGHVPGGSSSGSAVAVAEGMAHAGIGTDTGGSCRIPAAFNGLVGLKPTARRVPIAGVVPLAPSLDSVGPIGRSVACCAALDAILAGETHPDIVPAPLAGLRLAVATTVALDGMDEAVTAGFARALARLKQAGARLGEVAVPEFGEVAGLNARGGLTAAESFAWHRGLLAGRGADYDPRVRSRIARGEALNAADYIDLLTARAALIAGATARIRGFDALLMPTVPVAPPRIADLADDEAYTRINALVLRNPTLINMIDGCAISLPIHREGEAPVGLMVAGIAGDDRRILGIAAAIEAAFAELRS